VKLSAAALATTMAIAIGQCLGGLNHRCTYSSVSDFGSILPKTIATIYPEKVALAIGGPIYLFTKLLTPLSFILNKICNSILMLFHIDAEAKTAAITESELRNLLDYSHEEGVIESEERRMITNVVDFGDSLAKDVMVPRTDMAFANVDFTYDELVQAFSEEKYTRMPVYSDTRTMSSYRNLKMFSSINRSRILISLIS
jgi:CBS domain containing-hemolysin-like protein